VVGRLGISRPESDIDGRMGKLLLLFILVPAVELVLLIELGGRIGTMATLALIVLTGALGASLARWQGLGVVRTMKSELAAGRIPAYSIVDGVIILLAGALLMTPGFLTDIVGFLCLVPGVRHVVKRMLWRRLEVVVQRGGAGVFVQIDGRSERGSGGKGGHQGHGPR
jgi:UPF0716 protein FxsA